MVFRHLVIRTSMICLLILLAGCAASKVSDSPTATPVTMGTVPPRAIIPATLEATSPEPTARADAPLPSPEKADESVSDVAATVNGQPIMRSDLEHQAARFQAAMISQGYSFSGEEGREAAEHVRKQVLEAMIDQILIEQAAKAEGIVISDEIVNELIQMDMEAVGGKEEFERRLSASGVDIDEYAANVRATLLADEVIRRLGSQLPDTATQVRIRQILVDSEEKASDLRQQLDTGADFAELAVQHSIDEGSRGEGGELDFLPLDPPILLPPIQEAVLTLQPGQFAGPIATPYGYYLVQLMERVEARPLSLEMRQGLTQEAFIDWIEAQRALAHIVRYID